MSLEITPAVMQLRPFIKDKNFGIQEVLEMIQRTVNNSLTDRDREIERLKLECAHDNAENIALRASNIELFNALQACAGFKNWRQEGQPEFEAMVELVDSVLAKHNPTA